MSCARIAAARSLSTTASIPSSPRAGSEYTGMPPPPQATTIVLRLMSSRTVSGLQDPQRLGTRDDAAQPPPAVWAEVHALRDELPPYLGIHRPTHELPGLVRGWVLAIHEHLVDHRDHAPVDPLLGQGVLKGLLDHVPDPTGRTGHEHAERKLIDDRSGSLVANERIAHLRAVSVDDGDPPAVPRKLQNRREALTSMSKLGLDLGRAAPPGRGRCPRWR